MATTPVWAGLGVWPTRPKLGLKEPMLRLDCFPMRCLIFGLKTSTMNFHEGERKREGFFYLRRGGLNAAFGGLRCELSLSVVLRTEMPDICPGVQAMPTGVEDTELQ